MFIQTSLMEMISPSANPIAGSYKRTEMANRNPDNWKSVEFN